MHHPYPHDHVYHDLRLYHRNATVLNPVKKVSRSGNMVKSIPHAAAKRLGPNSHIFDLSLSTDDAITLKICGQVSM